MIALTCAAGGALAAQPALAADPEGVTISIDGCDLTQSGTDPAQYNPDATPPDLVCDDAGYVGGNLGKDWNELDLVPFRFTAKAKNNAPATQDYTIAIVVDHKKAGRFGYDVLSVPVLNTAKSDAGCDASPIVSAEQHLTPGLGGVDDSLYRLVTVTQLEGTTCVYDYYARLAVGSHLFPGASLHANLANEDLDTGGIGAQDRSIPVNEILPQDLDKTMEASRGADHIWSLRKSPTPASINFGDTCAPGATLQRGVSITVTWERLPATPSGDATIITKIYATNPAARIVTVSVTDRIYAGTTQTTLLDTASTAGGIDVPKNTANYLLLTHTATVSDTSSTFNDVATATYTDKVTGVPVPGQTTATATANVQPGLTTNSSATINDVESITGNHLSFSTDSFSGASGGFDGGYVAGTETTGPVSWTSGTQLGNGAVTFAKTIYLDEPAITTGKLSDTATLNGIDGFTTQASLDVNISSDANVALTINKTIPNVLQTGESVAFDFEVYDANNVKVATPTITFTSGETSDSAVVGGLDPGTYKVREIDHPSGDWTPQSDQTRTITLPLCAGSVTFNNSFAPATAQVRKITVPAGTEAGWDFTLNGPGAPVGGETVTTTGTGYVTFATILQEGSYTITETPKAGYDLTGSSSECSFTVDYPADNDRVFQCTYTNTQRGKIIVKKLTDPTTATQKFAFAASYDADGFELGHNETNDSGLLAPGTYSVSETVPSGWDLTSATCDDGSAPSSIGLGAGETVTCTFNNRQRGKAQVLKLTDGQVVGPNVQTWNFTLAGNGIDVSDTQDANGVVDFAGTLLVPGLTYTICETGIPAGWTTVWWEDVNGDGVKDAGEPDITPYNPDATKTPPEDLGTRCHDFTVDAGETVKIAVNNVPPPGGDQRTIGYWKNWSTCTGGRQVETAAKNGGTAAGFFLLDDILADPGITVGLYTIPATEQGCIEAVRLLSKSDRVTGKNKAGDAAYTLTAQLIAALANFAAGAEKCATIEQAVADAQALLVSISFTGTGDYLGPKVKGQLANKRAQALSLAAILDQYNNGLAC